MQRKLSIGQKWQVVVALLIMYFPVFMFLDYPVYRPNWEYDREIFVYQMITLSVMALMLLIWIYACEILLDIILNRFGESILIPLNIPRALWVMLSASFMGVAFIFLTGQLMFGLEQLSVLVFGTGFRAKYPDDINPAFFELYKRANFGFLLLLVLSTFFLLAYDRSVRYVKEVERKAALMEKQKVEAELNALRDQISPHFLFNSLSILDAIVKDDPEQARRFIRELSGSYRYILEQKTHATVSIGRELEFIQSYLFLLRMRFDNKVAIHVDIPEEQRDRLKIPPMTLQMLVENAVRHNRMSVEEPLQVHIKATGQGLSVVNNVNRRRDAEPSTGIGLQNIVSRYSLLTSRPVLIERLSHQFSVFLPSLD